MLMIILKIIDYLIYSISSVLIIAIFGKETKLFKKKFIVLSLLTFVIAILLFDNVNDLKKLCIVFLILLFDAFIMCSKKIWQNLIITIFTVIIFCIASCSASYVTQYLLKIELSSIDKSYVNYLIYIVFYYATVFAVTSILGIKNITGIVNRKISTKTHILLVIMIVLQLLRVCTEYIISITLASIPNLTIIPLLFYIFSLISIVLFCYCINSIINKENIIELNIKNNEKLKTYNEVLEYTLENQRKIAHEHGNNLAVLSGYLENKNYDKAKDYVTKIIGQSCNKENSAINNIIESGLKALILYKIAIFEKKGIEYEVVIDESIADLIIPSEDMCSIVGIFLDNALEASIESDEPYISISFIKNDNMLIVTIMNSIKSSLIEKSKIFNKGYSTKGEGRGFGLNIVKDIVNRYDELELITTVRENLLFIQELKVNKKINLSKQSVNSLD
ncbi:GHKL domain-containing protein [Sedimentibacter sp. zth1]|uniref:sensor histidine kinase n=1 Tax=Sedimentibacter sp. zth1 TaxID=2816908 RepID=UPI001A916D11|nr:GHKL domain-containing protein [Sedimentibacter sp. zth1]QSX06173.1 GHKL domain-containing protein [Sedimentibacter sp. zth1]